VIDPEGELYTLREKYDYVLAGKGGDYPATPATAELLARRLLEHGCSAVIDVSELKPRQKVRFVRLFLVALASRARAGFTIAQWATLSKLKKTGGTWSTYLSRLRTAGHVEQRGALWHATDDGIAAVGEIPPAPESPAELLEMWKRSVGGGAARMLDAISDAEPRGLSFDELADAVGITRSGGTFGTDLSRLRSNGLVDPDGPLIRLSDVLR